MIDQVQRSPNNGRSAAQDRRFWAALAKTLLRMSKKDRDQAKKIYQKITSTPGVKEKLDTAIAVAKDPRKPKK